MKVASFFSGIGGIDLGLEKAGMEVAFQCETLPFGQKILKKHWPNVPLAQDITKWANLLILVIGVVFLAWADSLSGIILAKLSSFLVDKVLNIPLFMADQADLIGLALERQQQ